MPRKQQSVDVYKFGGVSMSTPESVRLAAGHVREAPGPVAFIRKLAALDRSFAERTARARKQQKVLRYVATIERKAIRVGLQAVPESSPMGRLHGTDNQVAIYSKRYNRNPLVVTGPGAGAEVTAGGVLNDILAITKMERRQRR